VGRDTGGQTDRVTGGGRGRDTGGQREKKRDKDRELGEGGVHGQKLNVGMPVSLQPVHLIHEYCNRKQHGSSNNRQTAANEYKSIQGIAKILLFSRLHVIHRCKLC